MEELTQVLGVGIKRRTLQRRLATLVGEKRVCSAGKGRALKYRADVATGDVTVALTGMAVTVSVGQIMAEVYFPASPEGEEIKAYVRQPRQ